MQYLREYYLPVIIFIFKINNTLPYESLWRPNSGASPLVVHLLIKRRGKFHIICSDGTSFLSVSNLNSFPPTTMLSTKLLS